MGLPLSIYLPPYISEGGVVAVALVGLMFSISTLWDGVVDPLRHTGNRDRTNAAEVGDEKRKAAAMRSIVTVR